MIFLGYVLSADGISANPEKLDKLRDWPVPNNAKELHSFPLFGILLLLVYSQLCPHGQVSSSVDRSNKCQED